VSRGPGRAFKLLANRRGAHVLRSVRAKARPATPAHAEKTTGAGAHLNAKPASDHSSRALDSGAWSGAA